MLPLLVSVDKSGDLKLGRRKCRLHKKDMVVKVAQKYGIPTKGKTVSSLCASIKSRAKNTVTHTNNTPIAKMYPTLVKKFQKMKKMNDFMKNMVTTPTTIAALKKLNMSPSPSPKPKPKKTVKALTSAEAKARIMAMKGLSLPLKKTYISRINQGVQSPRKIVKIARANALLR